jgi:hypothetical protein
LGIMIPNGKAMGNSDDVESDRKRGYFIGGLWTFLPGLTLTALSTTWLVMGSSKTEISKGAVREERLRVSDRDCGKSPAPGLKLSVTLPGSEKKTPLKDTDTLGETSVDFASAMARSLSDGVPTYVEVEHHGETHEVALSAELRERLAPFLSAHKKTVAASRKASSLELPLDTESGPAVQRVTLSCKSHLVVSLQLQDKKSSKGNAQRGARREGAIQAFWWGGKWKKGSAAKLAAHKPVVVLCRKDTDLSLALLAAKSRVEKRLRIQAKPHAPKGEVVLAQGDNFVLDKGLDDMVVPGRTGKLYAGRRGKGTPFVVIKASKNRAVVKVKDDTRGGTSFYSRYSVDP